MNLIEAAELVRTEWVSIRPKSRWYDGYLYLAGVGMSDYLTLFTTTGARPFVPTYFDFHAEWEVVPEDEEDGKQNSRNSG